MKKRKSRKKEKIKGIPDKINEIISYLSYSFSKNNLFEKEDLAQDLYVLYLETIRKNPKARRMKPGWFYILFKWELMTRYRRRINHINKEWDYIREQLGYDPNLTQDFKGEPNEF